MCMILSEQQHNGGGRRRRPAANQECHRSGPGRDGADRTHDARRGVGYEQISSTAEASPTVYLLVSVAFTAKF